MKIKKHLLITLLLISPFLPQAQSPLYAFDMSQDEIELNLPQVIMWPNPAKEYVNFKGELISKLVIYDALGKIRKKSKPNSSNFAINISNLPSGIYIIQLWCENNQGLVKKLIIR